MRSIETFGCTSWIYVLTGVTLTSAWSAAPAQQLPPGGATSWEMQELEVIVTFLLFLIVMGIYLSWISRVRSFQGIPEISYSWVTMSLPIGSILLLITTWQKISSEFRGEREESHAVDVI